MTTKEPERFPVLGKPPIVEVVCGVHFEPLDLDGMVLGIYWDTRKDEFPERSLQPALAEGPGLILGTLPLRAVLVGSDKVHVLQIQHDRFYMNWRATGEMYPRFSNRHGKGGLMVHAIEEFGKLAEFCESRFGKRPKPTRIELSKIDLIDMTKYWRGLDELQSIVKITGTFSDVHHGGNREFALQFVENDGPQTLAVSVNSVTDRPGGVLTAVRVETRVVSPVVDADLESPFADANNRANRAFFKLISEEGLKRFEATKGTDA